VTAHHARIRTYMDLETEALQIAARRARVLDHKGSRGSDAEFTLREWLRRRVEPEYTASSGEIIDSFDTDPHLDSRQQDIVIHQNVRAAKQLELPSGLRLIPVETVAAVVEVKLALDRDELLSAKRAAKQTQALHLDVAWDPPYTGGPITGMRRPSSSKHSPAAIASSKLMPSARTITSILRGGTPIWRTPSYDAKSSTETSKACNGAPKAARAR